MVEGKDNIKDLFSEKLTGYEANVRPELWANISSQIGVTSGAAAAGGLSVLTKAVIGISIVASIVGVSLVIVNSSEKNEKQAVTEIVPEEKISAPEENQKEISETSNSVVAEKIIESQKVKKTNVISPDKDVYSNPKSNAVDQTPIVNNKVVKQDKSIDKPVLIQKNEVPEIIVEDIIDIDLVEENGEMFEEENAFLQELPNVFTPNGDNVNDFLAIETTGLIDFNIVVLDQNSTTVYKSNDPDFIWNGTSLNGDIAPSGNYIYYITARDAKGNLVTRYSKLRIER